jgi:predicted transcriptional regulator
MPLTEDAAQLLFELASSDRLTILFEVQKEPLKLSQMARGLSTTVQETFRQVHRLVEARLVERNPDGAYALTSLGTVVLRQAASFEFLAREREFVLSHDMAWLPGEFQERIGELLGGMRLDRLDDLLATEERTIVESTEFVWFMSDQLFGHPDHHPHKDKLQKVSVRFLLPGSLDSRELEGTLRALGAEPEVRFVDSIRAVMVLNERTAGVAFPSPDGRPDYGRGFVGDSDEFHHWCLDLYSYYWNGAKKR